MPSTKPHQRTCLVPPRETDRTSEPLDTALWPPKNEELQDAHALQLSHLFYQQSCC